MHNLEALPSGWEQLTHVDGKPYFRHSAWGVVTESYIRHPGTLQIIVSLYHEVEAARLSKKPSMTMSSNFELYLTIRPRPAYYFVDHERKSVFWLDKVPLVQLGLRQEIRPPSFSK
jgi:hypothetical protein